MRLPAAVALLLLALPAPGHGEEWTTYTDRAAGFSVSYPADWEAKSKPMPEAELKIQAPGGTAPTICTFGRMYVEGYDQVPLEMALGALNADKIIKAAQVKNADVHLLVHERRRFTGREAVYYEVSYRKPSADATAGGVRYEMMEFFTAASTGPIHAGCDVPSDDMELHVDTLFRIFNAFVVLPGS
ncbi:MAG: hypothetical protein HZA24_11960 [Nitrospirae bacterium]|nr:hypothetical protein [Nitrospirota bacterium]